MASNFTRRFGNISGLIAGGDLMGFQLQSKSVTYISEIDVSYRIPVGETKATKPFGVSRLIVVKRPFSELGFTNDLFENINQSDVIFDKFIYDYDGFKAQFNQLKSDNNGVISVVLFSQYNVSAMDLYSSLTVLGTSTTANLGLETI